MKKLQFLGVLVIPFIVLVLFTGCPSSTGGAGQGTGSFTYDGVTYPLTNATIDDYGSGYFELNIASAGIDTYEYTGTGDTVYFDLQSLTGTIASGTYDILLTGNYWMWDAGIGIGFNVETYTGTWIWADYSSGTVTITINGNDITVDFSITMTGGKVVTGTYSGKVAIWS